MQNGGAPAPFVVDFPKEKALTSADDFRSDTSRRQCLDYIFYFPADDELCNTFVEEEVYEDDESPKEANTQAQTASQKTVSAQKRSVEAVGGLREQSANGGDVNDDNGEQEGLLVESSH